MINDISLDNDTSMMTLPIYQLSLLELLTMLECVCTCVHRDEYTCNMC